MKNKTHNSQSKNRAEKPLFLVDGNFSDGVAQNKLKNQCDKDSEHGFSYRAPTDHQNFKLNLLRKYKT